MEETRIEVIEEATLEELVSAEEAENEESTVSKPNSGLIGFVGGLAVAAAIGVTAIVINHKKKKAKKVETDDLVVETVDAEVVEEVNEDSEK